MKMPHWIIFIGLFFKRGSAPDRIKNVKVRLLILNLLNEWGKIYSRLNLLHVPALKNRCICQRL